jgi:hypothetical protein
MKFGIVFTASALLGIVAGTAVRTFTCSSLWALTVSSLNEMVKAVESLGVTAVEFFDVFLVVLHL